MNVMAMHDDFINGMDSTCQDTINARRGRRTVHMLYVCTCPLDDDATTISKSALLIAHACWIFLFCKCSTVADYDE